VRILLVDDNPDDVDLTVRSLRMNHVANEIMVARDGAEAIDILFATGARAGHDPVVPVFVLLDLNLPKLCGLEVLRMIRADDRTRRIPVVILTSSKREEDLIESYSRSANGYIRKPVDFAKLFDAVRQLELQWLVTGGNGLP